MKRYDEVVIPAPAPAPAKEPETKKPAAAEAPPRWRRALGKMRRPAKRIAGLLAVLLFLALIPRIAELVIPRIVDHVTRSELGLGTAIGRVDIDIANLRAVARDVTLVSTEGGEPVAQVEKIEVDLAPSRIREGIVIERITVDDVTIRARRRADGSIDIAEAFARAPARREKSKPSKKSTSFLIEEATIRPVRLVVTDETGDPGSRRHELRLSVLAHDLGNVRRKKGHTPGGRFYATGTGDMAETFHVEGETDLASAKDVHQTIDARVLVAGLDPGALAASMPGSASHARRIGFSTRIHVGLEALVEDLLQTTVRIEDASYTIDGVEGFGMAVGEATFETGPEQPTAWRRAYFEGAKLPFERRADGAFTFLGFTFARQNEEIPPIDASSGVAADASGTALRVVEKIERALVSGGPPPADVAEPSGQTRAKKTVERNPSFPDLSLDELRVVGCEVTVKDKMTQGEPEIVFKDVNAEVHSPRWMDGRVIGGKITARAAGLAGGVEVLLSGTAARQTISVTVGAKVEGLDARLIDPYIAAGGRSLALEDGRLGFTVHALVEKESEEDTRVRAALQDLELVDAAGPRARVPRLAVDLHALSRGEGSSLDVRSVEGAAWVLASRGDDGAVTVAGFAPGRPDPKRPPAPPRPGREPASPVRIRDVAVDVSARFDDATSRASTTLAIAVSANDLRMGLAPRAGTFKVRGAAPGLARSIAVDGVLLPSAVTPAAALSVDVALESAFPRALLARSGWRPLFDDRRVAFRAAFAQDVAVPAARATVARVSSLTVTDSAGTGASVDRIEARLLQGADPAVVDVPLVAVTGPRVSIEQTPAGMLVARTLLKDVSAPRTPARPDGVADVRPRRKQGTTRIQRIRVDDGSVAVVATFGATAVLQGVRVRAGPVELGPGAAHALELDVTASALPFARSVHAAATLAQPLDAPNATIALQATGLDLEPVRAKLPDKIAAVTLRRGSFRAAASVRLAPLREGGFSGIVAVREVSLRGDEGQELLGLGEARARVLRFDTDTSDLDLAWVELDRLHVEAARDGEGRIEALGIVTAQQAPALTDEERREKEIGKTRPGEGREPEKKKGPPPPPTSPTAIGQRTSRISIDHFALADAHVRFVDRGVRNDDGAPVVFDAVAIDGTADRIVVGGPPGLQPVTRFELEARFEDGMRAAGDGVLTIHPEGFVDGRVEGELRGLSLVKVSRYAENAANVSLERGYMDGATRIDLLQNNAEGEAEVFARRLRIRRQSDNPLAELGSTLGAGLVLTFLTDWEGDTTITIPVRRSSVSTRGVVADVLQELILSTLGQPFKMLIRPIENVSGTTARDWREWMFGQRLTAPLEKDTFFAPGDDRLTHQGAEAVAVAAALMKEGGRQIRLRAECGPGDRARAFRAAALGPGEVRSLMASLESERRVREDERRDLAAAERRALAVGDLETATESRRRVVEAATSIARIDRSLADLAERAEIEGTPVTIRARAEDSLRRLSQRRAEAIRHALAAAGVPQQNVRIRPARIHNSAEAPVVSGGGGRVTVEVVP